MKKIFTFFCAALMSAGMWAETQYFIVGSMNEWTPNEDFELIPNDLAEATEFFINIDLTTTTEFKVVKVEDGQQSWFPEGMGNNYGQNGEITEDANYDVYFRPNYDGGEDWFYNCIYVVKHEEPADPNREYLSMEPDFWGWGYNCEKATVEAGLQATITGQWGAVSTGWDPERDLSEWDKIVIIVESMENCAGEWFKLKAYLRDHSESEANQMEGMLGLDADDNVQNYLVIDLHQEKPGFDLTQARILAIQCQPAGAKFTISSVYLLKEGEEGIETLELTQKAQKVVVDGNVLIIRDGKAFNLTGAQVK